VNKDAISGKQAFQGVDVFVGHPLPFGCRQV